MFSLVVADTARCLSTSSRWDGEFSVYYVACRPTCNIHRNDGSTHIQCAYILYRHLLLGCEPDIFVVNRNRCCEPDICFEPGILLVNLTSRS